MPLRIWHGPLQRQKLFGTGHVLGKNKRSSAWSRHQSRRRDVGARKRLCLAADLYGILQVPETATKAEIRTSYRQLARQLHPDANGGRDPGACYQAVTDAYKVLSDEKLRDRYDRIGYAALGSGFSKYAGQYGSRTRRRAPEAGKDVMAVMWLDLVEAALGVERNVQVKVASACPECNGGTCRAAHSTACAICRGSGEIMHLHSHKRGRYTVSGLCPGCGGKGAQSQQWCRACGGRGLARTQRSLRVRVPPGVDDNSVLRLRGSGDEGRFGGKAGDVYVSFVIRSRPDILRRGLDLVSEIPVAYADAILGSVYVVQTIRGTAELLIPAGTQHGEVLELAGGGIDSRTLPAASSAAGTGSHFYRVVVRLPLEIDAGERKILERLARLQSRAS